MIAIPKRDPDYDLHFLLFPVYHHLSTDPVFPNTLQGYAVWYGGRPDGKSFGIISFTRVKSGDKKQRADKKEIEFLHGCRIIIQDYSLVYGLYKSNQNMPLIKIKYCLNGHNNKVKLYQTGQ